MVRGYPNLYLLKAPLIYLLVPFNSSKYSYIMAPLSLQSTYKLVSGYEIPVVGFGVSILTLGGLIYMTNTYAGN